MYYSPAIVELLKYHVQNLNQDQMVMKSIADSHVWKFIDTHVDPTFGEERKNLRLGLSLDRVNPFPHCNTTHST